MGPLNPPASRQRLFSRWFFPAILLIALGSARLAHAGGLLYFVNTTSDTVIANACANGLANCSLRGAILVANSHPGADGIEIDLVPGSVINLTQALPALTDSVSISGLGADKLTVRRNTAGFYRIFNITTTGTVALSGMTMSNGSAGNGGAIQNLNTGTVNISHCVISGNTADSSGGIHNESSGIMNVSHSTITGNVTTGGGVFGSGVAGGIFNASGTLNVANCTISGNMGTDGGGIYGKINGTVNVSNSTITGNHALFTGGGLHQDSNATGLFRAKNCIIAGNTSGKAMPQSTGQDVWGSFNSGGFNLIGKIDGGNGFNTLTDQKGTNSAPLNGGLDPNGLQDNGGPTPTIRLLLASPAIDRGTSNGLGGNLTTDQRGSGFPRTFDYPAVGNAAGGDGTDIGAFESLTPHAVSRKMHGAVLFDIPLPFEGAPGVECRSSGGAHGLVFTFHTEVASGNAIVTGGIGSVSGSPTFVGNTMTVNLTGVPDVQKITLTLNGVTNTSGQALPNTAVSMNVLAGDTNGNKTVNATDVGQTKSQSGLPVTSANFRQDINANGSINATDVGLVKSRSGQFVP